jgi:hypothetical protein
MTTEARRAAVKARFGELMACERRRSYLTVGELRTAQSRLWKQAEEDVRRAVGAEDGARRAEIERLLPTMTVAEQARAYTEIAESLALEHDYTIEWRRPSAMPKGASAYADWSRRRIVVPTIEGPIDQVEQRFAIKLHEAGHILAGPCRGADHQPDPTVKDWHHCLRCETLAWERAMELWPFSREMFGRLQWSLGTYRRKTPGPATAVAALDRQCSNLTYAEHVHRRVDIKQALHAWRLLTPEQRLDQRWAEITARREAMRAKGRNLNAAK